MNFETPDYEIDDRKIISDAQNETSINRGLFRKI
jgi:hypothetical protein